MGFKRKHLADAAERMREYNLKKSRGEPPSDLPSGTEDNPANEPSFEDDVQCLRGLCDKSVEELSAGIREYGPQIMEILCRRIFYLPTEPFRRVLQEKYWTAALAGFDPSAIAGGPAVKLSGFAVCFGSNTDPLHYGYTKPSSKIRYGREVFRIRVSSRKCETGREWVGTVAHEAIHVISYALNDIEWCACDEKKPCECAGHVNHLECPKRSHHNRRSGCPECNLARMAGGRAHGPYFLGWAKVIHERFDVHFGRHGFPALLDHDSDLGLYKQGFTPAPEDSDPGEDNDFDFDPENPGPSRGRRRIIKRKTRH
ncbi:hypothetical protein AAVH_17220 [Aphelenchoides avenae]|nr:hypothetical protein AAVH_17220 [Aphelenchus avenae]